MVKKLVQHPDLRVQWLFISRGIEALVVDYAIARGEDPDLVWTAETVMLQPADSTAHDDHFHLRIACLPEEAVRGCEGGGPHWPWLAPWPELGPLGEAELAEIARDDPLDLLALSNR
jgi:penicillin-insensitive murein DD-endopeptidase